MPRTQDHPGLIVSDRCRRWKGSSPSTPRSPLCARRRRGKQTCSRHPSSALLPLRPPGGRHRSISGAVTSELEKNHIALWVGQPCTNADAAHRGVSEALADALETADKAYRAGVRPGFVLGRAGGARPRGVSWEADEPAISPAWSTPLLPPTHRGEHRRCRRPVDAGGVAVLCGSVTRFSTRCGPRARTTSATTTCAPSGPRRAAAG